MTELHIREERMGPHFTKFHVEGLPAAAVFHKIEPDHGDFHDHPWRFTSTVIYGGYVEEIFDPLTGDIYREERRAGETFSIHAQHVHRIVELLADECWTIILPGAGEQKSGFWRLIDGVPHHRFWDEQDFRPRQPVQEAAE